MSSAIEEGAVHRSVGRTVTEADIVNFAGVSGDFNRLHTDDPWVRSETPFDGRIAHGLLILAIGSGLRTAGLVDVNIVAYLEVQRRMLRPVYPGDTIVVTYRVGSSRESRSHPGHLIVTVEVEVGNQRDEVVQTGIDVWMVAAGSGQRAGVPPSSERDPSLREQ